MFLYADVARILKQGYLHEKLTFAVENVCTMESDYVTNDAEVGEGWRGVKR
jgi:hypothetical protein